MNKKQFLELLIRSFNLVPQGVHHYRTEGCDGQFEVSTGWEGHGEDEDGNWLITFKEPDGFNMAVCEILRQGMGEQCQIVYVSPNDWEVEIK